MNQKELNMITDVMYQNREEDAYAWLAEHLNDLKKYLLQLVELAEKNDDVNENQLQQYVIDLLKRILYYYQTKRILELADCFCYEFGDIIKLERFLTDGSI